MAVETGGERRDPIREGYPFTSDYILIGRPDLLPPMAPELMPFFARPNPGLPVLGCYLYPPRYFTEDPLQQPRAGMTVSWTFTVNDRQIFMMKMAAYLLQCQMRSFYLTNCQLI